MTAVTSGHGVSVRLDTTDDDSDVQAEKEAVVAEIKETLEIVLNLNSWYENMQTTEEQIEAYLDLYRGF